MSCNIKYLILSLLFFSASLPVLFSQKNINGVVNRYARVTSFGTDYVIVSDEGPNAGDIAGFEAGDTILLIQMKGVRTYVAEGVSYGTLEGTVGLPGQHEFLIVQEVDVPSGQITFRNDISHTSFNTDACLQIVYVPSFNEAVVTSNLTCEPWDSLKKTGGVLAVIADRTLTLNDSISVSGSGFLGGATAPGMGVCIQEDIDRMYKYAYSATSDSAGFKGEGPVSWGYISSSEIPPVYPRFGKGKGFNFSSGGGGNGRLSGGGGGGNYGGGGTGGQELGCAPNRPGGLGGLQIKGTFLATTLKSLFPGSGGGASTYLSGGTPTPGGNGGGIVIIVADTINGNNNSILADGGNGAKAFGDAGAGGGGGGGSVAIYGQTLLNMTLSARGGKGGDHEGLFGEGGGGGGGLITTNTPLSSSGIIRLFNGGAVGTRPGTPTGTGGGSGESTTNWVPILNGFLFNSIRSSVTNNQVDSICSDVIPPVITGTSPIGGSGSYSYTWLKSLTGDSPWEPIPGATSKDYTPTAPEPVTFWIRRRVEDNSTFLVDSSKAVKMIVQPAITGNIVGKDTVICYGQDPESLIPLNAGPSNGNGIYEYEWLQNNDNLDWPGSSSADGTFSQASYDPSPLTQTTYFARKVTSGRCISYSPSVEITVLPTVTGNNIVRSDSIICEGSLFDILSATGPSGGLTGDYDFQWQDSTASGTWQSTSAADIADEYLPDTSKFETLEKIYFRRVVYSGPDSVCVNRSLPILLTRWFSIDDNNISADQTICSGDTPSELAAVTPSGGDNVNYSFTWQDSTAGGIWNDISSAEAPYAPPALTDSTWYRRVVSSSECVSVSNKVVINVHDPITGNLIEPDTTICSGSDPDELRGSVPSGGDGTFGYQWYSSSDNFGTVDDPVTVAGTLQNYDPPSLTSTLSFRREVISGACRQFSDPVLVTVLPSITGNTILPDKAEVCYNTVPGTITGSALSGGAGGTPVWEWQASNDNVLFSTITGANTQDYIPSDPLTAQTWYRRIIRSGPEDCCIDTSEVAVIDTLELPSAILTSVTDTTICSGSEVELKIKFTGAPGWTLIYNENATPVTVNSIASPELTLQRTPEAAAAVQTLTYTLGSLTDNNGCVAPPSSLTGSRNVLLYRTPVANAGPDDRVCGPEYTLAAIPSDGTGTWIFPPEVLSGDPALNNAAIKIDSSFTSANVTYKFYWEESNWNCISKDSVSIVFDNRIENIDAGEDMNIMSFDNAISLSGSAPEFFETGLWTVEEGSGDIKQAGNNVTEVTGLATGLNTFKWSIENGVCRLEDLITIVISNPVIQEAVSPNGDFVNDTLLINGIDFGTQNVELTILNGAGTPVYSTSNSDGNAGWQNWTGKNLKGDDLPEGTYYYLLKVSSGRVPGKVSKRSGFIILKRY
ncbi:MAG: gliding motility-associated C-terminal domain-containing protein [Bacteroidales bacterium]|nr:gliding motility-associated C-terminal domain-containing protein [Bacteroidales bacterium]MBN2632366.1 gliding motility-associated C-terminal domain-containing protein [Bacteroidales bacterium]